MDFDDDPRAQAISLLIWMDRNLATAPDDPYTRAIKWLIWLETSEKHRKKLQPEFEAWLAENPAHRAAYLAAEKVWKEADAARGSSPQRDTRRARCNG